MYKKYLKEDFSFDFWTWVSIFCLIIVISGVFGFIYEYIFYFFNFGMKRFYWQGGNFLPWINIYAIGAIMIYFLTYKRRKNIFLVFIISLISCGLLEYFSGLGIYILKDGARYWNYNTEILNFGNIGGFICLRSVLFFGLSGLILIYLVVPLLFFIVSKVNKKRLFIISILVCSIFLCDEFYNLFARAVGLPDAIKIYKEIGLR